MSENIIVALHSQPPSSPSEYLGAEVTMGTLTEENISDLIQLITNDNLFENLSTDEEDPHLWSQFLCDWLGIDNLYHRSGLIYYDNLKDEASDKYSHSTDNWVFGVDDYNLSSYYDWGLCVILKSPIWNSVLKIYSKGIVKLSFEIKDLYFFAEGDFTEDHKGICYVSNLSENDTKSKFTYTEQFGFNIRKGIDSFHPLMNNLGFCGFNLLHSVYVHGRELTRVREFEENNQIHGDAHLLFKNGKLIAWLSNNNHFEHIFPFCNSVVDIPCISPYLKLNHPEEYEAAVINLIDKLMT